MLSVLLVNGFQSVVQASHRQLLELLRQELREERWQQEATQLKDIVQPSNSPAFAQIRF